MENDMNKYYAIFQIPAASMDEWMKNVSPEERKTQSDSVMKAWADWAEANKASIVDGGSPLGKTKRVTKDGVTDVRNDMNYLMVVQANSHDEAAKLIASNPHTQMIPSSFVDVMEVPKMGM